MALGLAGAANATEGGLGRVVLGSGLQTGAGVVPDTPIIAFNVSSIYFDGSLNASKATPVNGELALGLKAEVSLTTLTGLKVWNTGPGPWNFASSFTLPIIWNRATADVSLGGHEVSVQQSDSGLFDIYVTPIILGYHFSKTEHVAFSLGIWAPTGHYAPGRLVSRSLNYWTFNPAVAYTKYVPQSGLELTGQVGVQFNTRNAATDYLSAPLVTLDALATKKVGKVFSLGVAGSLVEQLGSDSGPLADRLNGFKGGGFGVGPIVSYGGLINKHPVAASLRWLPTVASSNRLSGNTFMATLTTPL